MWTKKEYFKIKINSISRKIKKTILNKLWQITKTKRYVKEISINDIKFDMEFDTQDVGLTEQLYFSGYREERSTKYFIDFLKNNDYELIVEAGANIGYFLLIEEKLTRAKIIAIEPSEHNISLLRRNIQINNARAEVIKGAVGPQKGKIIFYEFEFKNWCTTNSVHGQRLIDQGYKCEQYEVDVYAINDFINMSSGNKMLLRMDVEGYEYEILKNSDLKNSNVDIFVEFHSNILGKNKSIELIQYFIDCGYAQCVLIFNDEFAQDQSIIKFSEKNKLCKYKLEELKNIMLSKHQEEFFSNDGFELFLEKI